MFSKFVITALLVLIAASFTQGATKLANFVSPCSLKDPKLDDCLTSQGRALLPHLVAGVRDWDILSLDPLLIPRLKLQEGGGGSVSLSLSFNNSNHYGWKDLDIKRVKLDTKTFDIQADIYFKQYVIAGDYEASGRILLLPLTGTGPSNITFVNVKITADITTKTEERGGKKFLKVVDVRTLLQPERVIFRLDNLFNNKQLSDTMNTFLNENDREVFKELKVNVENTFGDITFSLLDRIFKKIPLKQLFKDDTA